MSQEEIPGKVRFIEASFVKSPRCECCNKRMNIHLDRGWVCGYWACSERGEPVPAYLTGIYPALLDE